MLQQTNTILQSDTTHTKLVSDTIGPANTILNTPFTAYNPLKTESILQTTTLQNPPGEIGQKINRYQNTTLIGICLSVLIFFTIIRFSFRNYLQLVINAFQNYQIANMLFLEKNMRNLRGSIFLNSFFFLNISLFVFEFYSYFYIDNGNQASIIIYLKILLILLSVYFLKMLILFALGSVFNSMREAREYLNTIFVYNKNMGIFLLPITLGVPFIVYQFKPFLLYWGIIIALFFFIYRLFRGIKILFRKHVSIFYMILYLCAFEILPLLVIIKFLKSLA